ncbi:MAG: hypothetical protein FJ297_01075 [Planctomycetes bacterium]|nr:hypothetical protein [Planctomycetota bacterium]
MTTLVNKPSWTKRTLRSVRRLAWLTLGAVALGFGGWRMANEYVNEQIRIRARELLAQRYPGLRVEIRAARREPGTGIELSGITIREPGSEGYSELIDIDRALVRCDAGLESIGTRPTVPESILIQRPRVRIARRANGEWNIARLIAASDRPWGGGGVPPITIEGGAVEFVERASSSSAPIELREVNVSIGGRENAVRREQSASAEVVWEGTCIGEGFPRASFRGQWNPETGDWALDGRLDGLQVAPELAARLPESWVGRLEPIAALRGRSDVSFRAGVRGGESSYSIRGSLRDGWLSDAALPYALTDLNADFTFDASGLRIENATGRSGAAEFELDLIREGFAASSPLVLRARTRQFPLDGRLPLLLTPSLRTLWERFAPSGTADVTLALTFDGARFRSDARITCRDLAFTYEKFPYRVHGAAGTFTLRHGELAIDLRIPTGGRTTSLRGMLAVVGEKPTGWIEIETDGSVPMDDELIAALPDRTEDFLRTLHPQGMLDLFGRFERAEGDTKFHHRLELRVHGGSMRYDGFPYPLDKIEGLIHVADDRCWFDELTGRNGSGHIVARGDWDPGSTDSRHLKLELRCADIPLEESLRGALRDDARQFWTRLQPQGTVDHVEVRLGYDRARRDLDVEVTGQKWPPTQNIEGRSITMRPIAFPYKLDNVTGSFHYHDGVVSMRDVRAEHSTVRLRKLAGRCASRPEGGWNVRFDEFDVEHLILDSDFLGAFPRRLGQALGRLHFRGTVNARGAMEFSGTSTGGLDAAGWNIDVDTEDGQLDCGAVVEHIRGGARLDGRLEEGWPVCGGEMRIDSLVFRGLHVTRIRGPLRIEPDGITLGAWARAETNRVGLPRSVTARALDGDLTVDARFSLSGDGRFDLLTRLADADLGEAAASTAVATAPVSGKLFADLRLAGQAGIPESWRGAGTARLLDADIYQLPLMVAMLKLLNVRPPDTTAFTQGDTQFRVEGDRVHFDRIGLQGDAISLIGNGRMNHLQRQLDLDFYSVVGREDAQLPLFRPLFKQAARSVLLIKVTGPLNQPNVTPHPFPELNETLQQLFPETSKDGILGGGGGSP